MKKSICILLVAVFLSPFVHAGQSPAECVQMAKNNHYVSPKCGYTFIKTCVQSDERSELVAVFEWDKRNRLVRAPSCPNMPDVYVEEWNK